MEEYKQEYNKLLTRYYKGCEYLKNNPHRFNEYFSELLKILNNINEINKKHPEMTKDEISNGFR